MNNFLMLAALDLVAILALCAMYVTRHRRRDLVVSYIVINVGVFAVTMALANADATSAGMGMGLFGVLSIIRLRSTELDQREVAYYFAALALGLLAGIGLEPIGMAIVLMAMMLAVMLVVDSGAILSNLRSQTITVDRAISDESVLKNYLQDQIGYEIVTVNVSQLDLINDKTVADIRYNADKKIEQKGVASHLEAPAAAHRA